MRRPARIVLLGQPVAHSLSPVFQNAALEAARIAAHYEVMDVNADTLRATMRELASMGAAGNVTIPHKERVAGLVDVISPLAAHVGAVNTWWTADGLLHGDNTDVGGFDDAVVALMGEIPAHARVTILGSGGAARAAAVAIAQWPHARLALWGRDADRALQLVALGPTGRTVVEDGMLNAVRDATLVVNATSIGLLDEALPIEPALLAHETACLDLVYRRNGTTPWVRRAREQGRPADDGVQMLIGQGARSWASWFGVPPDRDVMLRALQAAVPRAE